MSHSAFHDRCRRLFSEHLGHGRRWKTACAVSLGISRATLYRYFKDDSKIPADVTQRLDALEHTQRPLPTDQEMVQRYARALSDIQAELDESGSLRAGLPANAQRVFDIAAARNITSTDAAWPTDLASLIDRATRPLFEWIPDLAWDADGEFTTAVLIEQGAITPECVLLAAPGHDVEAELTENAGYKRVLHLCHASPSSERDGLYASWRRFVITHPVLQSWTTAVYGDPVLGVIEGIDRLVEDFYQPVPEAFAQHGIVPLCTTSGVVLRRSGIGFETDCREPTATSAARSGQYDSVPYRRGMVHLRRPFRMFWCLPGRAELELERRLVDMGWRCTLWPNLDKVDLVATPQDGSRPIAVDVKDYLSPTKLAFVFRGFKDYAADHRCYLAVPDYIPRVSPHFRSRFEAMRESLSRKSVRLRTISDLVGELEAQ